MRKLLMLVLVFLLGTSLVGAQDDDNCTIDLSSAASLIVEAQAQASRGDQDGALRSMVLARQALDDAIQRCGGDVSSDLPPNVAESAPVDTALPLTETYLSSNELFSFDYPDGWEIETATLVSSGGIVLMGTDTNTLDAVASDEPDLDSGELAMGIVIGTSDEVEPSLRANADLETVITAFRDQIIDDEVSTPSEVEALTVGERSARSFTFAESTFSAVIIAVDLGDGIYAVGVGIAAPDELAVIQQVAADVLGTVTYLR